jgi:hypothetical protein
MRLAEGRLQGRSAAGEELVAPGRDRLLAHGVAQRDVGDRRLAPVTLSTIPNPIGAHRG